MNKLSVKKIRRLLQATIGMLLVFFVCQTLPFAQEAQALTPTPAATEGPYWKAGSPLRDTLYRGNDPGQRIEVTGRVLDRSGKALPSVKIDVWQTDAQGVYDNAGFNYRGHVLTNSQGEYSFKTVKPGEYPSRAAHIHIKISAPDGRHLTTQLYFPELSERNNRDALYDGHLNVRWLSETQAGFDFVL